MRFFGFFSIESFCEMAFSRRQELLSLIESIERAANRA